MVHFGSRASIACRWSLDAALAAFSRSRSHVHTVEGSTTDAQLTTDGASVSSGREALREAIRASSSASYDLLPAYSVSPACAGCPCKYAGAGNLRGENQLHVQAALMMISVICQVLICQQRLSPSAKQRTVRTRTAAAPEIAVSISACWIVLRTPDRAAGAACTGAGCTAWAGGAVFVACIIAATGLRQSGWEDFK